MNLHEYQSKHLLKKYAIPVPKGEVVFNLDAAIDVARKIGGDRWVVKAQVHAGGRGKAGGVRLVKGKEELKEAVNALLGKRLVTSQTDKHGQPVNQVLIEKTSNIVSEFYLGAVIDCVSQRIIFMVSSEGGIEIEQVATESPEKILKIIIDPSIGLQPFQCRKLFFSLHLDPKYMHDFTTILMSLYRLFIERDLNLLEINPLIITDTGKLICLDAKLNVDDNALYRQAELHEMYDTSQENKYETLAQQWALSYIKLDGNIGCMVNGAGLAMATMDLIKLVGGEPANFLDVGGNATKERVAEAFKIIVSDKNIKGILVNIFGGIVRCDLIADGIVSAMKEVGVDVPVVVRLEGNNAQLGTKKLIGSSMNIIAAKNFVDAAERIVNQVKATT
ncbi:ADP-forming succinate--CoA ligase subunit beta [Coxiella endosymbiont of Amblyomma nuttalli]|uniref:ADP-forming succinate--CoA ligase subunit beta n=1 Tax=Coxiella endosymbiont of Amblyomma nuttalli TaxID=2749996 RepID=UPI001BA4DC8E|nr:ADP-forming succinate--CoA ligase subunit beta [Coxiella endosymbiont of Amblyomma nuttalli]QTS83696.1 Succinyl-CoA ligase [ADP-forming] subunit beta [Coxiella endosymbiont of Amblyomma nuttalli]